MHEIIVIFKKELKRFFSDKRILLTLILPGILLYTIYSLMGTFMSSAIRGDESPTKVALVGSSAYVENDLKNAGEHACEVKLYPTVTDASDALSDGRADIAVIVPDGFDSALDNGTLPSLKIFYDSGNIRSAAAYEDVTQALAGRMMTVTPHFTVETTDMVQKSDMTRTIMSMMLPLLVLTFLYSGSMSVSAESIAGEKERGTIATLLVTPVKRSHLALGKILALSVTATVSSVISFVAVLLSLPKLLGVAGEGFDLSIFGIGTYLGTFAVIITTVLLFTSVLSLISALSKSIKEASQYAGMGMLLIALSGLLTMLGKVSDSAALYLIPVFNSSKCLSGLFNGSIEPWHLIITSAVNLVLFALCVLGVSKIFDSERIMFDK